MEWVVRSMVVVRCLLRIWLSISRRTIRSVGPKSGSRLSMSA